MFNQTIVMIFNSITLFLLERHKHVKQVFIVGSAMRKDFCPFLSDLDLFIILKDHPRHKKLTILEDFLRYYRAVRKLNPFVADFWQSIVFEADVEHYHHFWYFYHDISHWRTLNADKFLVKFPPGETNLLIMANWDRALSWYIYKCHFFFNEKLPLYSRQHKIPSKVAFFSNRVQSFCAVTGETFSFEDFQKFSSSEDGGQNKKASENYKKSYATQADDFIKSFRLIQQSAKSITERLQPLSGITYEDPPYIGENNAVRHAFLPLLNLKEIPVVLSVLDALFIFLPIDINDERLRQCLTAIERLSATPFREITVFPVNVLPLFYKSYQMSIVHCASKKYLDPNTHYLKYLMRVRSVFAQGPFINTLVRHPDATKHLCILARDFVRIKLALEMGRFGLKPHTLLRLVKENRKLFSPEFEDIADNLLGCLTENTSLDKNTLYEVTDRLRKDNFHTIQKFS